MVDDIIFDREGCRPYIHIAANEQRRIKNAQSKRSIPIHPELLRLGFLDYVRKIRALGYKLLFPGLYSTSCSSPFSLRLKSRRRGSALAPAKFAGRLTCIA
jgi:hypothetical protein